MKKYLFYTRKYFTVLGLVLLMGVLLIACKKDDNNGTPVPVSGIMTFNLVPDQDAVGVALSGSILTNPPLVYTNYSGRYQNVYAGNYTVESYGRDTTLASDDYSFESDRYYSLFVTGREGVYHNVIVHDNIDSLSSSSGLAYIRYINAIPDSSGPAVTISAGGEEVVNETAAFTNVSEFAGVNSGDVIINVSNENNIAANRTISVEGGKVYTILLIGVPGSTDPDQEVQIKYVENGTLTPE